MSIYYHIYANDLAGGPIDYSAAIDTVSGLSYATSPIPPGSDARFAVRAFDTVSGLEERNTDAAVRIITDGSGVDVTAKPSSPVGLTARATAGGTAKVEWSQLPTPRENRSTAFLAWLVASPGPIDYTDPPTATVDAVGVGPHRVILSGLSDGVEYLIGVRAANASGDDGNNLTVVVTGSEFGPDAVDGLVASLI